MICFETVLTNVCWMVLMVAIFGSACSSLSKDLKQRHHSSSIPIIWPYVALAVLPGLEMMKVLQSHNIMICMCCAFLQLGQTVTVPLVPRPSSKIYCNQSSGNAKVEIDLLTGSFPIQTSTRSATATRNVHSFSGLA